jgi:hypothetical protein
VIVLEVASALCERRTDGSAGKNHTGNPQDYLFWRKEEMNTMNAKTILDLAQKIIETARLVLVEEKKVKKKPRSKKGLEKP